MGGDKLLDQIFNLKFTSKQLVKSSSKCEKEEKSEKLKVVADCLFEPDLIQEWVRRFMLETCIKGQR